MPSDDAVLTAEAVGRWHRLARQAAGDDPGLAELRAITYAGRRACTVARPFLVTRPRYESERLAVALVGSALAKTLAAVHANPELLAELGLTEAERDLVSIDPGFGNVDVNDRYDAFFSKRLGFVEVQGASPGGMGLHDAAATAFTHTAAFEALSAEFDLEPLWVVPALREAMLAAYRDWGGAGDPVIAIVDWGDAPLMQEFEYIRDQLVASGLQTVIVDPRDLTFSGGRLRHGGTVIDLVYRRLIIQDALARPDEVRPLVDAARAGAICLVNPFASDVLGHKSIFDLLTGRAGELGLTAAERSAVTNHVPWTRVLVADGDPPTANTIERSWALTHRERVVLKPAHDYGGHGVHVGSECDETTWELAVAEALELGVEHIVQRRIVSHAENFLLDEPGAPLQRFVVDNDPYTFRGKMGGMLVRLGLAGVTNVTAGATFAPAFLLGPK
jgi:hypothetical protein